VVAGLRDPVRREQYAGLLADLADVSGSSVLLELEQRAEPRGEAGRPAARRAGTGRPRTPSQEVEKEALKLLAQSTGDLADLAGGVEPGHFETERYRRTFELLRGDRGGGADLVERAGEQGLGELVAQLMVEPLTGEATREYAGHIFSRLEELFLGRRITEMKRQLERLNPTTDPETYDALFEELIAMESRRRGVRGRAGEGSVSG
jgi:DNA primase